jgi:hypothetical protein
MMPIGDVPATDPCIGSNECQTITAQTNHPENRMKPSLFLSMIYCIVFVTPAHAYIDPVTGSFLLQAIIGGFAAALVAIRRVREKILSFLGIGKSDRQAKSTTGNGDDV